MKILKSLVLVLGFLTIMTVSTNAVYTSQASMSGNEFITGEWATPTPTPTPTLSISPTPIPQARVVINEVYYDVAPDKGGDGNVANSGEWIELYNAGNASINLKDWTITDNTTARTINANHIIPAGGYAVIAKDNSVWSLYWTLPEDVEVIQLGQVIGGGLANGGDRLILKNDSNAVIDQISWGTDATILSPSIVGVSEGHSIERNPAGFDNNLASDFVNRTIPTPGT